MNCFVHPERNAVGVCRNCGKGLCTECAVETTNAVACAGCVERVNRTNEYTDYAIQSLHTGRNANYVLVLLVGFMGLGIGLFSAILGLTEASGGVKVFMLAFAVIYMGMGGLITASALGSRRRR